MPNPNMRRDLEAGRMVVAPGAYDVITARLFRHMGFKTLYIPGSQTGTVLGTTEPLTSLTQMAQVGETVAKGVRYDLPVILDAGAGFGEPVHVMHAVETLEDAGITAIHIEDQFYPKRVSYHRGLEHIVPIDVYQQRLEYALKARRSRDFLIIARNDGIRAVEGGSQEEAVRRAHAAMELGVDVIMPLGVRDREQYEYLRREIKDIPMLALAGIGPLGVKEFESIGYQVVIYPGTTIGSALNGIVHAYKDVLETGHVNVSQEEGDAARDLTNTLLRFDDLWEVEAATTEGAD
jgi:2-methylisocitrate lyase-like PEP mutase family enzyme